MSLSLAKEAVNQFLAARAAASQGLRLEFFEGWHPKLGEALSSLPESPVCPHELYRLLIQNPGPDAKRTILVQEGGEVIAVAGFRRRAGHWEPLTQWLVPGFIFPVKDGCIGKVLGALGLNLRVGWWRWETPPPVIAGVRDIVESPTYGMDCSEDFEAYWRTTSHFKNMRHIRRKCSGFALRVDAPGMVEWTVRNWAAKWCCQGMGEFPDLEDRLCVAGYLEERGLCHALSLHDGDEPVAAATLLLHRNDAVAYVNYRNQNYDSYGVMTRLADLCFAWAKETKCAKIDLGGGFDYKRKWAPENAKKWELSVCPQFIMLEKRASRFVRDAMARMHGHPRDSAI